ncbi:CBS domain-containing protein [Streptomyces caeni]|uniref:CBS domain-containing protein n=1 Tax=Streptomyces caeni TaxID=2307231 RepID=A0ABW4ITW3_9ACTN
MGDFAREAMAPGVVAVPPDVSLAEAAQPRRAQDVGDVLGGDGGRVLGVITDRDVTLRAVADGAAPLTVSAQAVCTRAPVVVGPDAPVATAVSLMRGHAVRRLPVVERGRPAGVVGLGHLAVAKDPTSVPAGISRAAPGGTTGGTRV